MSRCTDRDAAAIAGYSRDIFQRVWPKLVEAGMPGPHHNLKKDGTPSRHRSWDRIALERWAETRRDPRFREAEHGDALAGERARLEHRLARIERDKAA